jgi:hypothetical protein
VNLRSLAFAILVILAASAWVTYAKRPTAHNLRRAVRDTVPLL